MENANIWINLLLLVATAAATAIAWWQAIVAGRAEKGAQAAEDAALQAWSEASAALVRANQVNDVKLRGDYAWTLLDLGTLVMSARFAGAEREVTEKMFTDRSTELAAKSFAVGDASTTEITTWVSRYSRFAAIGEPGETDTWMKATQVLEHVIRLWYRDPVAALEEISRDPRVDMS